MESEVIHYAPAKETHMSCISFFLSVLFLAALLKPTVSGWPSLFLMACSTAEVRGRRACANVLLGCQGSFIHPI